MNKLLSLVACAILFCGLNVADCAGQKTTEAYVEPVSPRIEALKKQLAAGKSGALAEFWEQVTRQGTPLIEPVPGDDRHVLMTFLWRAEKERRNVVLIGGVAASDYANNQLTHLAATDLWYRTYRVRSDARFNYSFSLNDPLTFPRDDKSWSERANALKFDPLNHHLTVSPKDEDIPSDTEETSSVVELPGAPPQPWVVRNPAIPAGHVELCHLRSAILANERRVWVYTPPGYDPKGKPYGLLILFDGWLYVRVIPTPTILDNLIGKKMIPPLVGVFVDNFLRNKDWRIRGHELVNNPAFADFVAKELIPWIRQNYHVTTDPRSRILGGLSAGGSAAAFVALRYPELFGNVLSQSGAFDHASSADEYFLGPEDREDEWLARQFVASPKLPLRFYLEAGLFEQFGNFEGPTLLTSNRHMRDVLQAKGYSVHYSEFAGDHSELYWRGTLADGLLFLMGKDYTGERAAHHKLPGPK